MAVLTAAVSKARSPQTNQLTEPEIGDVIEGRYELRREIARGGAGVVFEAYHLFSRRRVAVKVLTSQELYNPDSCERLMREARALTRARHPHVVALLDAGYFGDGQPYLAMDMLEGRTLSGILTSRTRIPVADTIQIGRQLCAAIAQSHARGVWHRDLKPSNIFVAQGSVGVETIKLFDFGIAHLPGEPHAVPDRKLTQHGTVLGTPEYMSPEQLQAQPDVDHRAAIYALGITLYECLTGSVPFEGTYGEVLLKACTQEAPPLSAHAPDVPEKLARLIAKAISRDKNNRFSNVQSLGLALMKACGNEAGTTNLLGLDRDPKSDTDRWLDNKPAAPHSLAPAAPRRRFARAPYLTPVWVAPETGPAYVGNSEDISHGGLLIHAPHVGDNGADVLVRFALPLTGELVTVRAISRWVRSARTNGATGLQFVDLPDAIGDQIDAFVTALDRAIT